MKRTYQQHVLDKSPSNTCRRHPVNGTHIIVNLVEEMTGQIYPLERQLKCFLMIFTLTSRSKSDICASLAPRQCCGPQQMNGAQKARF